jgi:hypothetical protein
MLLLLLLLLQPRVVGVHPQPEQLGEGEEAAAVDVKVVLAKARLLLHRRRGVGRNFEHVVPSHRPAELEFAAAAVGVVYLLAVRQHKTLPRREAPDQRHVVLLAPTCRPGEALRQGFGVGKSEAPVVSDISFLICFDHMTEMMPNCFGQIF